MSGNLNITFGPMFSGKTSYLLKRLDNFTVMKKIREVDFKALIINSSLDTRKINKRGNLTTHSEITSTFKGYDILFANVRNLSEIDQKIINKVDYIAIDESQFFEDLVKYVKKWLKENKDIHCCGLIANTEKEKFGFLLDLMPYADEIKQIKAFCPYCDTKEKTASFTKWKNKEIKKDLIHISGSNNYLPVCGNHY